MRDRMVRKEREEVHKLMNVHSYLVLKMAYQFLERTSFASWA